MKKIRVYELAKEAGMENKALVAKLQELGYAVKSHSSTLEESEAQQARIALGLVQTETEEKRIQAKGGRTTIIRRRKTVVAPEPEKVQEPAREEAPPEEAPSPEAEPEEKREEKAATPSQEETVPPRAAEEQPEIEAAPAPEPSPAETAAPKQEQEQLEPEPKRKGLARVIKRAAIPVEELKTQKVERPKPRRAERPKPVATAPAAAAGDEQAKGKKKGKRFVKFHTEPEEVRLKKSGGKRKRQADVAVEDFEELGHIPARLKVGRSLRGGGKKVKQAKPEAAAETKAIKKRITVHETITVGDLAHRMGVKASEVIAKLMTLGVMATVNQAMDLDTATLVASEFGYEVEQGMTEEMSLLSLEEQEEGGEMLPRPPVVTVMGHVDHGKTSILDAIRKTDVAAGEAGGITQHIGAHYVRSPQGDVVFLDTPGHAAFTEMRSRGAQVTDIVVLVVAADDGVMDQTKEAINHARAAGVPILVCVNKIDKPDADPMRVKRELAELDLVPEEWGGDVMYCETSAKQNIGIDELLENILLLAEMLELKADPKRRAKGHVIEAQLHKGRGPVATVLVQQGTLKVGDPFVVGLHYGKVRSLLNDKGEYIKEAGPSMPVEIQGISGVPNAGDEFLVLPDEKMAKNVSQARQQKAREAELATESKISLDNLFDRLKEEEVKELRVALRADVQGTLEAFSSALEKLSTDEVKVKILNAGTGTVTESDVLLAAASDALIIGFNVRPSAKIQELAKKEKVEMRFYDVIYHALEDIKKAMVGMLAPEFAENVIGSAEVRQTFHISRVGTVAGCYVTSGKLERNAKVRVVRDGVVIYTGSLSSLKRFKDDVREVQSGYECGLSVENFNDIKVGDEIECFVMEEVEREL